MNADGILLVIEQVGAILVFILLLSSIQKWLMNALASDEQGRSMLARMKSIRSQAYHQSVDLLDTIEDVGESGREVRYQESKEKATDEVSLRYRFGEALAGKTPKGFSQGQMSA
jgi:ABC-type transport system involved in cytochrome bd biosynthesis fused ATPase/permease subunit